MKNEQIVKVLWLQLRLDQKPAYTGGAPGPSLGTTELDY